MPKTPPAQGHHAAAGSEESEYPPTLSQLQIVPEYSKAGYLDVPGSPRFVANFNLGWRFARGRQGGAEAPSFDDADWELVNVPHGVDGILEDIASGCANYQGPAHYRKVFTPGPELAGRRVVLHFDGVLGKSQYWLNGVLLKDHCSGFLPSVVDLTEGLVIGQPNVVTVLADNSDDASFPPGKPQTQLDFSYFGGIYRNVFLVATNTVHISNTHEVDIEAGGGIFAVTEKIDEAGAHLSVQVHLRNTSNSKQAPFRPFKVQLSLLDDAGAEVTTSISHEILLLGGEATCRQDLLVPSPRCWTPESPTLYRLEVRILDNAGILVDAVAQKLGIRTIELSAAKGLVLNGQVYGHKLIGANRHQDFAQLGFAVSDALQWRDAVKLRNAGMRIVRNAHYPQSPSFMDACDALGMFVIVNTPGWQFWNPEPVFEERVYSDIRTMVRRDRNRPSVLLWEPVLNETRYPEHFALKAHTIVHAEYPYPGCYTGADSLAGGSHHFDVLFGHPPETGMAGDETDSWTERATSNKVWFTREWGDNVDDWTAQNSPSRVARNWGESPQLAQAVHYGNPDYPFTSLETLHRAPPHHIGGALWHSFDHQRGYHPDPFYGGIMDSFRRPKFSYELFKAQREDPYVFIAHLMTPFSPADVTVFAQADSVRLYLNGEFVAEQPTGRGEKAEGMPAPIVTFKDVYRFMDIKAHVHYDRTQESSLWAEAIVDGRVVAEHRINRARRAEKIHVELDTEGVAPVADGTAAVIVVASLRDSDGTIKRLNNGAVEFEVTGAGSLVSTNTNTRNHSALSWGEAPAIIRLDATPGPVQVIARYAPSGAHMPNAGVLKFHSVSSGETFILGESIRKNEPDKASQFQDHSQPIDEVKLSQDLMLAKLHLEACEKQINRLRNQVVENQQREFGAS